MNILSSPALIMLRGKQELRDRRTDRVWFCTDELDKFVEIPLARLYWMEASETQWVDQSGTAIEVKRITKFEFATYYKTENNEWGRIYNIVGRHFCNWLDKFKFKGDMTTVYFRLLYR